MPVTPKITHINGIDVREQTLDEFISNLPEDHCVKLQLAELRDSLTALNRDNTQLLAEKAGLTEQIGELTNRLKKADIQVKIAAAARKKVNDAKIKSESEARIASQAVTGL